MRGNTNGWVLGKVEWERGEEERRERRKQKGKQGKQDKRNEDKYKGRMEMGK